MMPSRLPQQVTPWERVCPSYAVQDMQRTRPWHAWLVVSREDSVSFWRLVRMMACSASGTFRARMLASCRPDTARRHDVPLQLCDSHLQPKSVSAEGAHR